MIYNEDKNKITWLWADGKLHSICIKEGETEIDLEEIFQAMKKVSEEKKDLCDSIYYLGVGLTGSHAGGKGFLLGWLLRSLKQSREKPEARWEIFHESNDTTEEEQINATIEALDFIKKQLEEKKMTLKDMPILKGDGNGPADIF